MMQLEIEIDEAKGEIVGEIPDVLNAILTRVAEKAEQTGKGKGVEAATEAARKQIEDEVKRQVEMAKKQLPLDQQQLAQLKEDNEALTRRMTEAAAEANTARKARDEQHASDLLEKNKRLDAQAQRIKELTGHQIRGLAAMHGAREESLAEIEFWVLHHDVGFDDNMVPFIKDDDGKPKLHQGKPLSLESHVKAYLSSHSHHRRPAKGGPAGALGRSPSLNGQVPTGSDYDAAKASFEESRSLGDLTAMMNAHLAKQREAG